MTDTWHAKTLTCLHSYIIITIIIFNIIIMCYSIIYNIRYNYYVALFFTRQLLRAQLLYIFIFRDVIVGDD